jgi:ferredoxin
VLWVAAPRLMAMFDGSLGRSLGFAGSAKPTMVVDVDTRVCGRSGFCTHAAPDVFRLRDSGKLVYRTRIGLSEVEAVSHAVQMCPVRAISLSLATTKSSGTQEPVVVADDPGSSGLSSTSRVNGRRQVP